MTLSAPFINADMGEGVGLHRFGNDETLMGIVDAINVACGFHAGDPEVMAETVQRAGQHDIAIGAHPGFPDIAGFGRRRMDVAPGEVESLIRYQVGALDSFLRAEGLELHHIKPHGALFGLLAGDEDRMREAARVNLQYGVPFFGLAGTAHQTVCEEMGVPFISELYVDLNYSAEGKLLIRRKPELADPEDVRDRVTRALTGRPILSEDGAEVMIEFQSICVHSDASNSPEVASTVRSVLDAHR